MNQDLYGSSGDGRTPTPRRGKIRAPIVILLVVVLGVVIFGACAGVVSLTTQFMPKPTIPVALATSVAPTGAPQVAPTAVVKATVPATPVPGPTTVAGATTVPATPTLVAGACDPSKQAQLDFATIDYYAPYSLALLAQAYSTCKNGVNFNFVDMTGQEMRQVPYGTSMPLDQYYPPLSAEEAKKYAITGTPRVLLTTQNSCILYGTCRVVAGLDQSSGADAIVAASRSYYKINTWDDALDIPYIGGAVGNVNEYFPKAIANACGKRGIGDFNPRLDTGQAAKDFMAGTDQVFSGYEPYVGEVLTKMPEARVLVSSKTFVGIWDVLLAGTQDSPVYDKAILAMAEAYDYAAKEPLKAWQTVYEWAKGHPDREALLGYTDYDEWLGDLKRVSFFSPSQNAYIFGAGKNLLVDRLRQAQETFTLNKTWRQDEKTAYTPPQIDPALFVNAGPMNRIADDPRMKTSLQLGNDGLVLSTFAPAATGKQVLSRLPLLNNQTFFDGNTADFAPPAKAKTEFQSRVLDCLKMFRVNFQVSAAPDSLAQTRASRVKNLMLSGLGVTIPEPKVVVTTDTTLAPGQVTYSIVGTEE